MKVYYDTGEAAGNLTRAVVTTGSFDGVHVGHKIIIDRLNQMAREIDGESVLITFHPHPRKVLYPEQKDLKLINSQEEKIELLRKTGLDNLIVIPFSVEFSKTTSHDFVTRILIGELDARVIVIGHNHHFGHNRQGDYSYLHALSRELGFSVEEIPLKDIENETVSSTKIRKALQEGNIQRANAYLDHQYIIRGTLLKTRLFSSVSPMEALGMEIPEKEKLIPPPGIYATNLLVDNEWVKSMGLVSEEGENIRKLATIPLDTRYEFAGSTATLYFYKKVSDLRPDALLTGAGLELAKELVEDLIY
ncbi:MAG: FAD synthetase family protein [Bacteroidales bacterium]